MPSSVSKFKPPFVALICVIANFSCATYQAKPLPVNPSLIANQQELGLAEQRLGLKFSHNDGFDEDDLVSLALIFNPDVALAKDDEEIAKRSTLANSPASLLTLGYGEVLGQKVGTFDAGLGFDVASLLSLPSRNRMEKLDQKRATLSRVWQEWQVGQQARILFGKIVTQSKIIGVLESTVAMMNTKIGHMNEAIKTGDLSVSMLAIELSAASDLRTKLNDAKQLELENKSALANLLGFSPEFNLVLKGIATQRLQSSEDFQKSLQTVAKRRPDLVALALSYEMEEEREYQAVLAQFPNITLGFTRSRDSSNVTNSILGISLNLPIFYRGKDVVRLEEATRKKQWDEYQFRINSVFADASRLTNEKKLLDEQVLLNSSDLSRLEEISKQAGNALSAGAIDALTYSDLRMAYLNRQIDVLNLQQLKAEREIALETLLGNMKSVNNRAGSQP